MRDLAPGIMRQRLLIEGYWTVAMDADAVRRFLLGLAGRLGLRTYGDPVVFAPSSGMGRDENGGWDAFVPLIDSGISGYFWAQPRFFSVVLYTCAEFDEAAAIEFTRDALGATGAIESMSF